jgi:hypothetical protein
MASKKLKEVTDGLTMFAVGAGGAILSSWAVNFTPGVKTANPATRSAAQFGLGLLVLMATPGKYRLARCAGMGIAWAGALGAVERVTKMKTLAGNPEGTLSPSEIRALQSMGALPMLNGPATMRHMNGPVTMHAQGARPSMMGGFKSPT